MNRTEPLAVAVISLGCAKNLVDSEHMVGVMLAEGIVLAASPEQADVILVNTCSFIRDAQDESIDAIREACEMKKAGPCRAVVVAGCLPQRYQEGAREALREVDAFIGVDELDRIGDIVRRIGRGERDILEVSRKSSRLFDPLQPRVLLTDGPHAYIKIAEGCNHPCGFCAIPRIRGRYRSRPIDRIVAESEHLLASGIKELDLISQDVTSYGIDLKDGSDLPKLLRALGRIGGRYWLRLLYGYPAHVTDGLLAAMGEVESMCRYLDVPVQHSHPDVLTAMGRSDTIEAVASLPERARRALPGIALRTTCLVGYPGETDAQFEHLLAYIAAAEFDHVGVFAFSREEQTRAFHLPHQVDAQAAAARRERLMLAQQEIVRRKTVARVGERADVLIAREAEGASGVWVGRTARQAPEVDGETFVSGLPAGDQSGIFVRARLVGPEDVYDLRAEAMGG